MPRPRMPRLTLEKGTTVYHGTSILDEFYELAAPAWVTTSESVAVWFAKRWSRGSDTVPRVMKFKTTRSVKLIRIDDKQDWEDFVTSLAFDESEGDPWNVASTAEGEYGNQFDGWIIPQNYPDGDDILLFNPADVLEYVGEEIV